MHNGQTKTSTSTSDDVVSSSPSLSHPIVTLDVGGRLFKTFRATLTYYPNSLLGNLFLPENALRMPPDSNGHYFFDRNPDLFGPILEFYRTGVLVLPKGISKSAMERELSYFGLIDTVKASDWEYHVPHLKDSSTNRDGHSMSKNASLDRSPPQSSATVASSSMTSQLTMPFQSSAVLPWFGSMETWAASMACRFSPIITKAMESGLLRFTVFIDPYGTYRGVPSQLNMASTDMTFWQDFSVSFAAGPPGSSNDFSQAFRQCFNVTMTANYPTQMRLPGHAVAVMGTDARQLESEALSWVIFRSRVVRSEPRTMNFVDRRGGVPIQSGSEENALFPDDTTNLGLVLLSGWELNFNMPESLTASHLQERIKSNLNGFTQSEDVCVSIFLLN